MIFRKKTVVDTRPDKIEQLLTRGVESLYPSKEFLVKRLSLGDPVTLYLGIDPTGPTLHIGHAIILMKLAEFQKMGHKIILLIGDFTGMIGDPTDKTATRKQLTHAEVLKNSKQYKKQAATFLLFSGKNKAELKYNSKWLAPLTFEKIIALLSQMTVDQMLKRDMFKKRMEEGKPIHLHEFLYPIMQGYDSVAMNVDGEIGGNDQTFNMLAGRDLVKSLNNKEKFVVTMKLLADTEGKKMGKSEGNAVDLTDSGNEMFGKVMSWTDGMIVPGFELCTRISNEEIATIKNSLASGSNPRDSKVRLAREIVSIFYGRVEAENAEKNFVNTFSKGGVPDDIQTLSVAPGTLLADALLEHAIVSSKTDWRRLISEGAVTHIETGEKIVDQLTAIKENSTYKIGKKRFVKFVVV